jgi:hypothetical protein
MPPPTGYHCRVCGQFHEGLPLHYGPDAPAYYYMIPQEERAKRTLLSPDQCVIDDEHYFICGNIDIPIIGHDELFSWDVWVSLSEKNFARAHELWTTPGRESEPPYFGWLSSHLPGYPETLALKTNVHTREVGRRPFIQLEPTDHPLAVEQRTGITWDRVQEIAELILHPKS